MPRRQPTSTLFPYTTLFRSALNLEQAIQMAKGSSAMSVVRVFLAALLAFACAQAPMAAHGGETASTHKGSADLTLPFRSEEHTSELQSRRDLVCRLLLEKKK